MEYSHSFFFLACCVKRCPNTCAVLELAGFSSEESSMVLELVSESGFSSEERSMVLELVSESGFSSEKWQLCIS